MKTLLAAALLAVSFSAAAQNTTFNSPSSGYPGAYQPAPIAAPNYGGYQQPTQPVQTYTPPPQPQPMPAYTVPQFQGQPADHNRQSTRW